MNTLYFPRLTTSLTSTRLSKRALNVPKLTHVLRVRLIHPNTRITRITRPNVNHEKTATYPTKAEGPEPLERYRAYFYFICSPTSVCLFYITVSNCKNHCLRAILHLNFLQNAMHMRLYGALANEQLSGNLFIP